MKKNILYTLALLSIFAACAKTELPHFGGENDPNAVTINPSVAVLSTKSNPLGDDTAQTQFNEGDVITIKDKSDNAVYKYALGSDGRWKPTDDGKCLLWHSESLNIEASYGDKGTDPAKGVKDQRTAAEIASADYMTFSGTVSRTEGSNELSFSMTRQQALVTVIIASYGDQYNPNTDFITELSIGDINPYIRNKNGEYSPNSRGTIGYKYSAIIPQNLSFSITYKIGQDLRIVDLTSNTNFVSGNSYTINLRVGKDKIEIGDITVSDWGSIDWDDAEAKAYPYVTFSAASEQKFSMVFNNFRLNGPNEYFEYSVGGSAWTKFSENILDVAFGGSKGDLRLRGKSINGTAKDSSYHSAWIQFTDAKVPVYCSGDIRTLIDYETYWTASTAQAKFCNLFRHNSMLMTAPELPATTLATHCYYGMFSGCKALKIAPKLPATTLATHCYMGMFARCTALTTAPELPATTLEPHCYNNMFDGCTALTTAPELPAKTLETHCYYYMFAGCTALTIAPELPATTLKTNCYEGMFAGCTALTTAPELPAKTLKNHCYECMFNNCTSLSDVTMLATDLSANYCLYNWLMDAGTSAASRTLTLENDDVYYTIHANSEYLPDNWKRDQATINYQIITPYVTFFAASEQKFKMNFDPYNGSHFTLGANEYFEYSVGDGNWTRFTGTIENVAFGGSKGELRLRGKSSKGTADDSINYCYVGFGDSPPVKCYGDIRTLVDYENYSTANTDNVRFTSLFDGCKALISGPELPSTNLASYCYRWMFKDCSSLTTAPALPATTLADRCYEGMFYSCSSLTAAPKLIAPALVEFCYSLMFCKCTSLEEIHLGASSGFEIIENSLKDWLVDTSKEGIVYCTQELLAEAGSEISIKKIVATYYGWDIELDYTP